MGQGSAFHWAQLGLQEVAFLPLKVADRFPGKGWVVLKPVHRKAPWGDGQKQGEHPLPFSGPQGGSTPEPWPGPAPSPDGA